MSRILIAGAGAVGQWLGAKLTQAGHDVTALCRPKHAEAIRGGLQVTGETAWSGTFGAVSTVDELDGVFDGVFITCKAYDTDSAAALVARFVAPGGCMVSVQNGLGNGDLMAQYVAPQRIVLVVTSNGLTLESPGHVYHAGAGLTHVGPFVNGASDAAKVVHAWLKEAGLDPHWHGDMAGQVWLKAIINAGINPVAAVANVHNGALLDDMWLAARSEALVAEAAAVARAAGIKLPNVDPLAATRLVLEHTTHNYCSMLQDVRAGRRTEIAAITGHIVAVAKRVGVLTPESEAMVAEVQALEPEAG